MAGNVALRSRRLTGALAAVALVGGLTTVVLESQNEHVMNGAASQPNGSQTSGS
ncbi:hypothetical protein [Frankia sp. R43]|uniref:hypothetical protein n=1 Tax=Frankia sp. R43 TaxID=269536 RepID=UPI00137AC1B8|nr:hypothetical protein [Frankia sp. R43]